MNCSLHFFLISLADLSSVERKVNNGQYTKLCEFIGDVMRIFENCRFFNQPNTSIMKSAQSLETFFSQKLSQLREKVAASWTRKKIQHLSKQEKKSIVYKMCIKQTKQKKESNTRNAWLSLVKTTKKIIRWWWISGMINPYSAPSSL